MTTIKGPAIFLAQFMGDEAPFNTLDRICKWAAGLGFKGVQIPSWDPRCIDLKKAAESKTYADEIKAIVAGAGMEITELSSHLQGQLVAVHPAYDAQFDGFAPKEVHGNSKASTGNSLSDNPDYKKGLALVAGSDCLTCHKVSEKVIGPAYKDVAAKYENTDANIKMLAAKVIKGGGGNWGPVPMTPHPQLKQEDVEQMIKYILLLKK